MRRIFARPRRLGTPVVLCVVAVTLTTLAIRAHGFPVQHLNLNDGGVWVTDKADGAIGRFNKPVAELDGTVTTAAVTSDIDVFQSGDLVTAYSAGKLYAVDPSKPAFTDSGTDVAPQVSASGTTQIALNGDALAVLATDNTLRATVLGQPGASVQAVASGATPLAKKVAAGSVVAVDANGDIIVAGGGKLRSYPASDSGTGWGTAMTASIPFPAGDQLEVTAVGDTPVVADPAKREVYLPDAGKTVTLPAADSTANGLVLQQSSAASAFVVAATPATLYSVNLATGQLTTVSAGHSGEVAAPVQLDGCVHAAWANGEQGSYVRTCGGAPATAGSEVTFNDGAASPSLVFRVNHDEVVLNDTANGDVFLVDSAIARIQPQWQQLTHQDKNTSTSSNQAISQQAPLVAKPVTQGVRPGRTTVVHVLDDDSGPAGALLAVTQVTKPDNAAVTVTVAPDGQTVLATVAPSLFTDAHFEYTIDDGHGHTASAQVTLSPHGSGVNGAPHLRDHYTAPSLSVASGGHLVIPVVGDWRDPDGDPLYVDDNSDPAVPDLYLSGSGSAGTLGVTSSGAISFAAPQASSSQTLTLHYAVSDGIAKPVPATLSVNVLGASSSTLVSPVAEPDVVQAIVGMPVTIHPLANDIPGADPTNPQAQLTIAAPARLVSPPTGGAVSTDQQAGTVTFTAHQAGSFLLSYSAAFGATAPAAGTIRVQATAPAGSPRPPVVLPALAVLHGQQPATVDVLANDYDPQGWVLGVTSATSSSPGIHVAVVNQRWLRISSDNPQPGTTATATYQVSDGLNSATGSVSITAEAAAATDQITTQDATVTIRAGDSAAVPVLSGDSSSAGLPLSLASAPPSATPAVGGLIIANQGSDVRVDAPAGVTQTEETTVSYVATDSSGATAAGQLFVTIEPAPSKQHPDQPPSPQNMTVRETAGDVALISIPTTGIDPDGDSTTVTGVTVPPALGRIVAIGPDTISYQSYPTSAGTDSFTYQVTDPYGLTGTATVSVGILPPGVPQAPVAVDDVVTAPPGALVHADVLANDIIAPGDPVIVRPLSQTNKTLPAGARLDGSFVYLRAPASPADPPATVTYGATDGSTAPSLARFIVRAVSGAKVAPVANDDLASPPAPGAASVTVNVLANDDDPVGSASDLKIIYAGDGATVRGPDLVIPVTAQPRQVPYEIQAPDGLTATAVAFVPGTASSAIRLKPGARITLSSRGLVTVPLSSVLLDSSGRSLRITTTDDLAASPAGDLTVTAPSASALKVSAPGSYSGPGAVTVQVYDGATIQDTTGHVVTLTIPVQVGPDVPLLRCPSGTGNTLSLVEGGAPVTYNIGLLCHVWTDTTVASAAPRFTASWVVPLGGVSAMTTDGGTSLRLQASSSAKGGAVGTLRITPAGSPGTAYPSDTLTISVIAAPPPSGSAVSLSTKAGQPVTVDLSQYVTSPLPQPVITVTQVTQPAGGSVSSTGSRVTVTPAASFHGTLSLVASVTDEPGHPDRVIPVAISVAVIGVPGAPGAPSAKASSGTLTVSFAPAAPNGAPVLYYTVFTNGAGHQCAASPCSVSGLTSGTTYSVHVTATNSAGQGPASAAITATPNQVPGQPGGLNATPADSKVTLTWGAPTGGGSTVTKYVAEVSPAGSGGAIQTVTGTSATFTGLTDGTTYSFRVQAYNSLGAGPWSASVSTVPFGKPPAPAAPSAVGVAVAGGSTSQAITVTWAADQDNGSPITGYTVTEYKAGAVDTTVTTGGGTTSTTFTVPTDGSYYSYTVAAANAAGTSAPSAQSAQVQGIAPPGALAAPTASDNSGGVGYNGAIQVTVTGPSGGATVTSVQYGLNGTSESGSWSGSFAGSTTETISGLTNGTNYVVYARACNSAGCGAWSGASNQVNPYTTPSAPSATATASGQSITFSWSGGGGGGRALANYEYCINDGSPCFTSASASVTKTYGYSVTHSVTVYFIDTIGQKSAGGTSPSVTTAAQPAAAVSANVQTHTVTQTITPPPCTGSQKPPSCGGGPHPVTITSYDVIATATNFTPGATLTFTFSASGSSTTATATADSSGGGSATSPTYTSKVTVTITVTDKSKTATTSVLL